MFIFSFISPVCSILFCSNLSEASCQCWESVPEYICTQTPKLGFSALNHRDFKHPPRTKVRTENASKKKFLFRCIISLIFEFHVMYLLLTDISLSVLNTWQFLLVLLTRKIPPCVSAFQLTGSMFQKSCTTGSNNQEHVNEIKTDEGLVQVRGVAFSGVCFLREMTGGVALFKKQMRHLFFQKIDGTQSF